MDENDVKELLITFLKQIAPDKIMPHKIKIMGNKLLINNFVINLMKFDRIFVVGAGKSTGAMAVVLEKMLLDKITDGVISVLKGTSGEFNLKRIRIIEGNHPYPDSGSLEAAQKIMEIASEANERDLIISLISGGGSALMAMPMSELTLEDKIITTRILMLSGADIYELNTVRKHISQIKGGRLAKKIYPAKGLSLIFSDVVGDKVEFIASGPTAPDPTTYDDAYNIVKKYGMTQFPQRVIDVLKKGVRGEIDDTPKPGDSIFSKMDNIILANNDLACNKLQELINANYSMSVSIVTTYLKGDVKEVSKLIAGIIKEVITKNRPFRRPIALIFGGETTVKVTGNGKGGRNQELVLYTALELEGESALIASVGTDGLDGNSPAAGGVIDSRFAWQHKDEILEALKNNDSYSFLKRYDLTIETGPTYTNLNDVFIAIIR